MNVLDAAAAVGVKHVVYSSAANTHRATKGRIHIMGFDSMAGLRDMSRIEMSADSHRQELCGRVRPVPEELREFHARPACVLYGMLDGGSFLPALGRVSLVSCRQ